MMGLGEASWEVTTRVLWAIVASAILLAAGLALGLATLGIAALSSSGVTPGAFRTVHFGLWLLLAGASALFGYATRYPTENDHDTALTANGTLFVIRLVISLAGAGFFLRVSRLIAALLLGWAGPATPADAAAVHATYWIAWAIAALFAVCRFTRASSVALAVIGAGVLLLIEALMPGPVPSRAAWWLLVLAGAIAFRVRHVRRVYATAIGWFGMVISMLTAILPSWLRAAAGPQ